MVVRPSLVLTVLPYVLAAVAAVANTTHREVEGGCSAIGDNAMVRLAPFRILLHTPIYHDPRQWHRKYRAPSLTAAVEFITVARYGLMR